MGGSGRDPITVKCRRLVYVRPPRVNVGSRPSSWFFSFQLGETPFVPHYAPPNWKEKNQQPRPNPHVLQELSPDPFALHSGFHRPPGSPDVTRRRWRKQVPKPRFASPDCARRPQC